MTSRRHFLASATAVALTGCAARHPLIAPVPSPPPIDPLDPNGAGSLKAHAAARGFLFGCAVDIALLGRDEGYARLVREQSAILVAENSMKFAQMRPGPDRFHFEAADALLAFAETNHMKLRGHNLCWHKDLPSWFAGYATAENARELLRNHIETVVSRYAGRMHSWDVVNEAVSLADKRPDGLRKSAWLDLIGEDYIELAFGTARQADPEALLTYNDYGIEGEDDNSGKKRAAVLMLLRRLKARNVPIDAMGIQSHIRAGSACGTGLRDFMAQCRALNLQIFISELDVNDQKLAPDIPTRDAAVAESYGKYLDLVLAEPSVRAVLTWGITDRKTWLNGQDARADHEQERCLPFGLLNGQNDAPKPAFFAMRNSFDGRKRI